MNIGPGWPEEEPEPPPAPKPKKKRKGPFSTWSEQQWTEHGFRSIKIRAPLDVADRFDALARSLVATKAETLAALLETLGA